MMRKAFPLAVPALGVIACLTFAAPVGASADRERIAPSTYPWCEFDWYCDNDDLGVLLDEGPERPRVDNDLPGRDRPDRDRPDRDRPNRDRGGR